MFFKHFVKVRFHSENIETFFLLIFAKYTDFKNFVENSFVFEIRSINIFHIKKHFQWK